MKVLRCEITVLCLSLLARGSFAGTLVTFHMFLGVNTYIGDIDVELYDKDKPVTVKNFLDLAQAGYYQNSFFHRLVPGFVMQGGGYLAINPIATDVIAPPYANLLAVNNFGNITNEFNVGKFYSNTNGTIAMAKTSDPNSANSQFFFNLVNNAASLDNTNNAGGFTVFGHVVRDSNGILIFFNGLSYGDGIVDLSKAYGANGIFTQLPNALVTTNPPPYNDLIYFTLSILSAQVKVQNNGSRQISWNTINGVTNSLEYSTNLPPVWQVLTNVVGTGVATNVIDSSSSKMRFYRIHVLY